MSKDWRRSSRFTKKDREALAAKERAANTCPACMGDNYAAGISISRTERKSFRRCLDCGYEPNKPDRVPLTEAERLAVEWEFPGAKVHV